MGDPFVRSITFSIAATATSPAIQITAIETATGTLQFTIDVISTAKMTGDLRGLFFDFNRDSLLSGLNVSGATNLTTFDTINVTNLGNGVTMQSAGAPYDVGVAFGTANLGKDDIKHQTFTLASTASSLTLDDIAGVDFGVRLTSVGSPTGSRTGSSKLVTTATAAPDAKDDTFHVYEDGQADLAHPATASTPLVFQVLANDTDADHDVLIITGKDTPGHGTLSIVDGNDADLLPGDALQYTPSTDYDGSDQFRYAISDGHGGTDFAWVHVNIAAVADVPTISYTIEAGGTVNEIIVHVASSVHDLDGSEYIDRFVLSGLPAGVQVTALDHSTVDVNPSGEPVSLARDFLLTLPKGQSSDFDFTVTAIAREKSNGDEEENSVSVPIELVATDTQWTPSFLATDRSLWGTDAGFDFSSDQFFGVDLSASGSSDGLIGYDYATSIRAGIQASVELDDGVIDANLDYALGIQTQYNHTTDALQISSTQALTGGGFSTTGMEGSFGFDLIFNYLLHAAITYNILDVLKGEILGVTFADDVTLPLLHLDSATLAQAFEFDNGSVSLKLAWPDTATNGSATPPPVGEFSAIADQPDFSTLDIDIDALLGLPFHWDINLPDILNVNIDIADIDLFSGFDFFQSLVMQAQGLQGVLTFEDGSIVPFVFGSELNFAHASAIDAAGNNDGTVDFTLTVDPQATLTNHTSLDFNLGVSFSAMTITGAYNVLDLASGPINVGPLYGPVAAMAPTPPLDVFNGEFALDFVGQDFAVSA
jgi:hypothetical protein